MGVLKKSNLFRIHRYNNNIFIIRRSKGLISETRIQDKNDEAVTCSRSEKNRRIEAMRNLDIAYGFVGEQRENDSTFAPKRRRGRGGSVSKCLVTVRVAGILRVAYLEREFLRDKMEGDAVPEERGWKKMLLVENLRIFARICKPLERCSSERAEFWDMSPLSLSLSSLFSFLFLPLERYFD